MTRSNVFVKVDIIKDPLLIIKTTMATQTTIMVEETIALIVLAVDPIDGLTIQLMD